VLPLPNRGRILVGKFNVARSAVPPAFDSQDLRTLDAQDQQRLAPPAGIVFDVTLVNAVGEVLASGSFTSDALHPVDTYELDNLPPYVHGGAVELRTDHVLQDRRAVVIPGTTPSTTIQDVVLTVLVGFLVAKRQPVLSASGLPRLHRQRAQVPS